MKIELSHALAGLIVGAVILLLVSLSFASLGLTDLASQAERYAYIFLIIFILLFLVSTYIQAKK